MTLDCSLKDLRLGVVNGRSGFHLSNSFHLSNFFYWLLNTTKFFWSQHKNESFAEYSAGNNKSNGNIFLGPPCNAPPQTRGELRDNLKRLRKIILKSSKKFVVCDVPYFLPCQRVESQNDMHSSLPFPFIKQHFDSVHDEALEPAAVCCVCIVQRYFKHQTRPTPLVFNSSHDALLLINKQIPFLDFATL